MNCGSTMRPASSIRHVISSSSHTAQSRSPTIRADPDGVAERLGVELSRKSGPISPTVFAAAPRSTKTIACLAEPSGQRGRHRAEIGRGTEIPPVRDGDHLPSIRDHGPRRRLDHVPERRRVREVAELDDPGLVQTPEHPPGRTPRPCRRPAERWIGRTPRSARVHVRPSVGRRGFERSNRTTRSLA